MTAAQARIKQQLEPLTSDTSTWLGRDAREMVASIDRKIADFHAHRQKAIADPRQMDAQIARAKAVEKEMQSLGERIQTRTRQFMESQAPVWDRAVRADLETTRVLITSGNWFSRWFTTTKSMHERVQKLEKEAIPNLEAKKQAYLDAKGRRAPQAEIDRALEAYYRAAVDGFNYMQKSGQGELESAHRGVKNLERLLTATRFIRDGSFTVGAMLIPGAQGVGVASGVAAVGALGLMKTGTQLLDEKPAGGDWTPGSAGQALMKNTANLGVDAISGAGYLKLGKVASNAIPKIGGAGLLGAGSGTAHRLIEGQGTDLKKVVVDGGIGAATFGLGAKIGAATQNMNPVARQTANAVVGGATAGGAQVVSNVVEGRPITENVDVATAQGAGIALASGIGGTRRVQNIEDGIPPTGVARAAGDVAPRRAAGDMAPKVGGDEAAAKAAGAAGRAATEIGNTSRAQGGSTKMVLVVRGVAPNEAAGSLLNGAGEGRVNGLKGKNDNEHVHGFVVDPSSPFAEDAIAKAVSYANRGANLEKNGSATHLDDGGNVLVYRMPESSLERTQRHVEAGGEFSLAVRIPPGTKPIASLPAVSARQPSQWLEMFSKMASADKPTAAGHADEVAGVAQGAARLGDDAAPAAGNAGVRPNGKAPEVPHSGPVADDAVEVAALAADDLTVKVMRAEDLPGPIPVGGTTSNHSDDIIKAASGGKSPQATGPVTRTVDEAAQAGTQATEEAGRTRLSAKERRARDRERTEQVKASERGGEADFSEAMPKRNTVQNKQAEYVTKDLDNREKRRLHDEIDNQRLPKEELRKLAQQIVDDRRSNRPTASGDDLEVTMLRDKDLLPESIRVAGTTSNHTPDLPNPARGQADSTPAAASDMQIVRQGGDLPQSGMAEAGATARQNNPVVERLVEGARQQGPFLHSGQEKGFFGRLMDRIRPGWEGAESRYLARHLTAPKSPPAEVSALLQGVPQEVGYGEVMADLLLRRGANAKTDLVGVTGNGQVLKLQAVREGNNVRMMTADGTRLRIDNFKSLWVDSFPGTYNIAGKVTSGTSRAIDFDEVSNVLEGLGDGAKVDLFTKVHGQTNLLEAVNQNGTVILRYVASGAPVDPSRVKPLWIETFE
jgi:hypothetical protein